MALEGRHRVVEKLCRRAGGVPGRVDSKLIAGVVPGQPQLADDRLGVALVASQDGHFTIFKWSPCEQMVHAHRVETLLL